MQVRLNGDLKDVGEDATIARILQQMEVQPRHVAVEVNRTLVPREEHAEFVLHSGDEVEIVTLAGGG